MKTEIKKTIAQKGINPIISTIDKTVIDLKRLGDSKGEIIEFLSDTFGGVDSKIDNYIKNI